jgi:four helix bundle protein
MFSVNGLRFVTGEPFKGKCGREQSCSCPEERLGAHLRFFLLEFPVVILILILILISLLMSRRFDHEKLEVYQTSLVFIAWLEPILQKLPKSLAVTDQLDRASTSIPLNIAEGNGKFTGPDRCRFFDNARGSALECAAALDTLVQGPVC